MGDGLALLHHLEIRSMENHPDRDKMNKVKKDAPGQISKNGVHVMVRYRATEMGIVASFFRNH